MDKKKETTLRCVTVLTIIAVVCGVLLAILYPLLYVAPSVDSISANVTNAELGLADGATVEWNIEELNDSFVKGKGASVQMVATAKTDDDEFYGILIKTNADGKLQECQFAIYVRKSDDMLFKGVITDDGATSGRDYEYAITHDKLDNIKSMYDGDYYAVVSGSASDIYGNYETPKCGATKTVTAVDNAFRLAVDYYYNVYGGGSRV